MMPMFVRHERGVAHNWMHNFAKEKCEPDFLGQQLVTSGPTTWHATLTLAHRPFPDPQPYAEQGPVVLHADRCEAYGETEQVPQMFLEWNQLLSMPG